ncbi:ABC transporter substrate-binding protein [Saccharothrix coeruleofusca]|uniref:Amino acid ABC transporter substrate-binding protein n=1 Tax=Saccharothrix coeruleofusca TaxID=33919 RepID=A0A918ATE0_9PSEU|nr:ABC transporter substrate-binding protein [Saccharothrix coeruleofusca]MBP2339701.1 polar amino acid transport system substrate-binding protein [Saccharothrix coeruleofusca]GGP80759.1 amino acid ABC transporter substrate-binding protein [Saccharothrix coeruleofusca]
MRSAALILTATAFAASACAPADQPQQPAPNQVDGAACTKAELKTLQPGKLTFGTDQPVYEPWFVDDDPSNGKGFESAVAYAVAGELGYAKEDVTWTRVPFNAAIQPGRKSYDLDLNEFSITEERKQAVDFSAPYYDVGQAVVTLASSKAATATTLADLRKVKVGAQVGTTSYNAAQRLQPEQPVAVYNTNDDAKAALRAGQVDALVVDLPTAFFITSAELEGGKIVGQIPPGDGKPEQFGIVLDKGSPLTGCVSLAVTRLKENGKLAELEREWLAGAGTAPELK